MITNLRRESRRVCPPRPGAARLRLSAAPHRGSAWLVLPTDVASSTVTLQAVRSATAYVECSNRLVLLAAGTPLLRRHQGYGKRRMIGVVNSGRHRALLDVSPSSLFNRRRGKCRECTQLDFSAASPRAAHAGFEIGAGSAQAGGRDATTSPARAAPSPRVTRNRSSMRRHTFATRGSSIGQRCSSGTAS